MNKRPPGTCWTSSGRCPNPATHILFAPDGKQVPGMNCQYHAHAAVTEYKAKLGERWRTERVADDTDELIRQRPL